MSDTNNQLVSIFARWRNLQDQKAAIAEDSKELFAEAKSNGFEPKALRIAFAEAIKADEPVSDTDKATADLVTVYLATLGGVHTGAFDESGVWVFRGGTPAEQVAGLKAAYGTNPATRADARGE